MTSIPSLLCLSSHILTSIRTIEKYLAGISPRVLLPESTLTPGSYSHLGFLPSPLQAELHPLCAVCARVSADLRSTSYLLSTPLTSVTVASAWPAWLFHPWQKPLRKIYWRWGNCILERDSHFPKVTQFTSSKVRIRKLFCLVLKFFMPLRTENFPSAPSCLLCSPNNSVKQIQAQNRLFKNVDS